MADEERLTDLMFGLIWPPASVDALKRSVVADLAELQALRGTSLTEEEHAGWRAGALNGLADNRHPEPIFLGVSVFLGLLCAGLLAYALTTDIEGLEWGAG